MSDLTREELLDMMQEAIDNGHPYNWSSNFIDAIVARQSATRPSDEQIMEALFDLKAAAVTDLYLRGPALKVYRDAIGDAMDIVSKMLLPFQCRCRDYGHGMTDMRDCRAHLREHYGVEPVDGTLVNVKPWSRHIAADDFYLHSDVGIRDGITLVEDGTPASILDETSDQGRHSENPVIATKHDAEEDRELPNVGDVVIAEGIPGAPHRRVERVAMCVLLSDGRPGFRGGIPWEYWPVESVSQDDR
jgi:hypothetical protein